MAPPPPAAQEPQAGSVPVDVVWLCTVVFFAFLVWYRRRKRAELEYFLSLQEQAAAGLPAS